MDWATTVGVGVGAASALTIVIILLRWGVSTNESEMAARRAQVEQTAHMQDAVHERDLAVEARAKAESERDAAVLDARNVRASFAALVVKNTQAVKERIDAATDDDLVALAHVVLGSGKAASGAAGSAPAPGRDSADASLPRT